MRCFRQQSVRRVALALLLAMAVQSCAIYRQKDVHALQKERKAAIVSPAKAHLLDGGVVVYPDGFVVEDGLIRGSGQRYTLQRERMHFISTLRLDSVAALEYYSDDIDALATTGSFINGGVVGSFGAALLAVAIFGSCPTIYTDDGVATHLEAEAFSYSIAPRFEADDLDRLDSGRVVDGIYRLHVTNEAAETHYINRMNLVAVDHPLGTEAFPANDEHVVLFGQSAPILSARSRDGLDVSSLITARDERVYRSADAIAHGLADTVTRDWIDLALRVPEGARSMTVALRMRNTLFNTVLLYDVMLASQGPKSVDWLGSETCNLFYAWSFYRWYTQHFGMHITVREGDRYVEATRLGDAGPIAWRSTAAKLASPEAGIAHVRLEFLPDNWMIDWAAISFDEQPEAVQRIVPPERVGSRYAVDAAAVMDRIARSDDVYLITTPGDRLTFTYRPPAVPSGMRRSYFASTRGYYIEWIRGAWLAAWAAGAAGPPFEVSDASITLAAKRWQEQKPGYEQRFFGTRFAVPGGAR